MQPDNEFLKLLWRTEGHHWFAQLDGKTFRDVLDVGDLVEGRNTYFAVAGYHTKRRLQSNVLSLPGWWIDFDTKNDGYPTKDAILDAFDAFTAKTGFPMPSCIVDSGNGIHMYWLTDESVDINRWQSIADGIVVLCKFSGLRIDTTRTADSASVMRLPGTPNMNNPDRAMCKVIAYGEPVFPDDIARCLPKKQATSDSAFGVQQLPDVPGDAEQIVKKCATLRHVQETGGDVTEPLWYAALQIAAHCDNADEVAELWSEGHEDYSPEDTAAKLDRARGFGPTLCERFQALSDKCGGCPFAGKISTPLQLGRSIEPVEPPPATVARLPDVPKRIAQSYAIGQQGVWTRGDEDSAAMACWVPLYVESLNETHGEALAVILWQTPQGTWRRGEMPLVELSEPRRVREWLLGHAITNFSEKIMVRYLRDFATEMLNDADPSPICTRFGWGTSEEFFIGNTLIERDTVTPVRVSETVPTDIVDKLAPKGNGLKWSSATVLLDDVRYWKHAFATLVSLASPILHVAKVQGAVASFTGESGVGKTVATRFALSVWGDPDALQLSPQGTVNSKGEMFRLARHLPVLVDDVSLPQANVISELVYMAANGKAKERVSRDGTLRGQQGWQLALLCTTNSPLLDLPERHLGDAERRRIVELDVVDALDPETAAALMQTAREDGGSVAASYVQLLIETGHAKITEMFEASAAEIRTKHGIPDVQRFGIWLCAAASVAGKLAREAGLIVFDWERVVSKVAKSLGSQSADQATPVARIDALVQQYLNENSGRLTVKRPQRFVFDEVKGPIAGAVILHKQAIAIPASKLTEYMMAHRVPSTAVKRWLASEKIQKGTELLSKNGGREWCYHVPMSPEQIEMIVAQYGDKFTDEEKGA